MLKQVFGPVPSRRLGQSLGIDPVPLKTCNWNCIYCQLGRTSPFKTERRYYFKNAEILAQVRQAIDAHQPGEIDWVTFIGSGETTLHAGLGEMIRAVKKMTDLPVAVITNGSLLYQLSVRQELMAADAVLPSLDAGSPELYRRINRPHPEYSFERLTGGMIAFRETYDHKLWVEVMLIQGLNDTQEALEDIAVWLDKIRPDEVHLVQPTRPPAETWVRPPDETGLSRAKTILGETATLIMPAAGTFDLDGEDNLLDALIGIITRHPMKESELVDTLTKWSPKDVRETLDALAESGKAQRIVRQGIPYWSASEAIYGKHHTD